MVYANNKIKQFLEEQILKTQLNRLFFNVMSVLNEIFLFELN